MRALLLFISIISATLLQAQSKQYDELAAMMKRDYGATTMSVGRELLSFVEMAIGDDESKQLAGDLAEVRLILVSSLKSGVDNFVSDAVTHFPKGDFTEMKEDEKGNPIGDDGFRMFVLRRGLKIKECHLITGGGSGGAIVSFFGDFHIKDLMKLKDRAEKMK